MGETFSKFFSPPSFLKYSQEDVRYTISHIYTRSPDEIHFAYLHPYCKIEETTMLMEWISDILEQRENIESVISLIEDYLLSIKIYSDEENFAIFFEKDIVYPLDVKNLFFVLRKWLSLIKEKIFPKYNNESVVESVLKIKEILSSYQREKHLLYVSKIKEERERAHSLALEILNSLDV